MKLVDHLRLYRDHIIPPHLPYRYRERLRCSILRLIFRLPRTTRLRTSHTADQSRPIACLLPGRIRQLEHQQTMRDRQLRRMRMSLQTLMAAHDQEHLRLDTVVEDQAVLRDHCPQHRYSQVAGPYRVIRMRPST